jgi:SAM-dependent methyltransferase
MDALRRTHNAAKRDLIQLFVTPGSNVLDCGCGRGGDLWKWKAAGVNVYAIDPDEESLEEAEHRAFEMGLGVSFLGTGDIRHAAFAGPFDVVCYNFSIHYIVDNFAESVKAIAAAVRPGGLLIGITPDKARALLIANQFGYFKDRLDNEFQIHQGGRRLNVKLSDGPFYADGAKDEPLLDSTVLIEALGAMGFDLVTWEPMLKRPNGLISDLYSRFAFRKIAPL